MRTGKYRRVTVTLPADALRELDRIAERKQRSQLVSQAINRFLEERKREEMRESLKAGALARAEEDVEMAEEFFPAEQEIWDRQLKDDWASEAVKGGKRRR